MLVKAKRRNSWYGDCCRRLCRPLRPQSFFAEMRGGRMREDNGHELVRLATAANPFQAHILGQALQEEGVHCQVVGDYLDAGIGDIPGMTAEVWVEAGDVARAVAVMRQHEHRVPDHPELLRVFQSKAETKAFYNKISRFYDLLAEHSEEPMRQCGLEKLNARSGEKVLEIGFGTGHCLAAIARAVGSAGKVHGIDLSEGMLQIARENLQKEGLADRVELKCGDAVQLPYASNSFDGVFMTFTLELFDTPEIPKVLAECQRVLRPGGRIVVVGVSKEGQGGPILHAFEWSHRHFPNLVDCRPIFVRRALEQAGFQIHSADRKMMWVPVEIVLGAK
jgi:ubiquinone/menaquinone biosynthesis C-methylase UbiE